MKAILQTSCKTSAAEIIGIEMNEEYSGNLLGAQMS
jgi:hypothetical protein